MISEILFILMEKNNEMKIFEEKNEKILIFLFFLFLFLNKR